MIDGCLIRSGSVQSGETIFSLSDQLIRVFPHMGKDSLKVICEDGKIYDSELPFSAPTHEKSPSSHVDDALIAVGVVEGHMGVKIHHGMMVEEVLQAEASAFSEKITDYMDFGVYDFSGEQLASIEDMIALVSPEHAPEPLLSKPSPALHHRKARRVHPPQRRVFKRPEKTSLASLSKKSS